MTTTEESNLVTHARRELELAGLFDEDSDYDGMLGPAALKIVEAFSGQGHSGMSAMMTLDLATRLCRYENLTPLTNNPDEWLDHTGISNQPTFQSKRRADAFSEDGGKTYYLLSDEPRVMYESKDHLS